MKMIDHNHFICHLILGTFTEYPNLKSNTMKKITMQMYQFATYHARARNIITKCLKLFYI